MFKVGRWRCRKQKINAVFSLNFHATQIPRIGWEAMTVYLVPADTRQQRVTTEKAAVIGGQCRWMNTITEIVKLVRDPKTGMVDEKIYRFLVYAIGSAKSGLLGEIRINLSDYAEVVRATSVSLPLENPDSGLILHVTIQRIQAGVREREGDENGARLKNMTSQLKSHNKEKGSEVAATYVYSTETKYNGNLVKSSSTDSTSASGSDGSSGQYTPKKNGVINCTSPISNKATPRKEITGLIDFDWRQRFRPDWFISSPPNGGVNWPTSASVETELREKFKHSIVRFETSDLELQTLQNQVKMERRRGDDLSLEIKTLRDERDEHKRESNDSRKIMGNSHASNWLHFNNEDLMALIEEIKQELHQEKNLNASLQLQLTKTQESNKELILAIRNLDELLEKKSMKNALMEKSEDEEQDALEVIVKEHKGFKSEYSLEQKIIDLKSEIELYKKDCEDLEIQFEQLDLECEILRQENHTISSKLEQTQMREQLGLLYECSSPSDIIMDLEARVRSLEIELEDQAKAFKADVESISCAKVEQEKRAIRAEEALRMTRWENADTAGRLKDEFELLSSQISSTFCMNEELAMRAMAEADELRLKKTQLEESLERTNEELSLVKGRSRVKIEELLWLLDFKTSEVDKLLIELKNKSDEMELKESLEAETEQLTVKETEILLQDIEFERGMVDGKPTLMREELHDLKQMKDESETMAGTLNSEKMKDESTTMEVTLNSEVTILRTQCEDLNKEKKFITSVNRKFNKHSVRLSVSDGTIKMTTRNKINNYSASPHGSKEFANLRQKIKLLERRIKLKDAALEDRENSFMKNKMNLSNQIEEQEEGTRQRKPKHHKGKVRKNEEEGSTSDTINHGSLAGVLDEMKVLKEKKESMEVELN